MRRFRVSQGVYRVCGREFDSSPLELFGYKICEVLVDFPLLACDKWGSGGRDFGILFDRLSTVYGRKACGGVPGWDYVGSMYPFGP